MPRFRLPHSRGNVRGLKKEEEGKVSLIYSEPEDWSLDDGTLELNVIERLCDSTKWTSRDKPIGTGDHEQFRFVIHRNYLEILLCICFNVYLKWE